MRECETMGAIDFAGARRYALERLERELPGSLLYHSPAHTRDDVLPAVERLAGQVGVAGGDLLLLRTAALFHDVGYVERVAGHEAASARIAAEALPHFGYRPAQVAAIAGMIRATRMPQTPRTHLEALLTDADLDSLGRDDFLARSLDFRAELAALGTPTTNRQWFGRQLAFLRGHRYWTWAARSLRDAGKLRNVARLRELLEALPFRNGE
jgi:uncharacterized protein